MSRQYQNLLKYAPYNNFKVLTTYDEFIISKQMATNKNKSNFKIYFECLDNNHKVTLNFQSYMNNRKIIICQQCVKMKLTDEKRLIKVQKEMMEKYKVEIVSYEHIKQENANISVNPV